MTLQICLTSCGQDSKLDIGSPEELSFREKVVDKYYCHLAFATIGKKNEAKRDLRSSFRMMAGKFCVPDMVEYYACFGTRKILSTNDQCERPSPAPSEAEILQCADDVSDYLSNYVNKEAVERIHNLSDEALDKELAYYAENSECLRVSQDGTGLQQYN